MCYNVWKATLWHIWPHAKSKQVSKGGQFNWASEGSRLFFATHKKKNIPERSYFKIWVKGEKKKKKRHGDQKEHEINYCSDHFFSFFFFRINSENLKLCWRSFDVDRFKVINNSKEGLAVGKDPWELWTPLYPMPVSPIQQGNQGSRLDSSTKNDLNMGWKAAEGLQLDC